MAQVELAHLRKYFGKVLAVHDLSLIVPDRQFVTLLGPSGCGKTTTLNVIAGLEDLDQGNICVDRVDITAMPPNKRDMAMVFQSYALYPHMSVFDNIAFGLQLAKLPKSEIKQRVEAVADTLQIGHLLARAPRELSGGQRQRVALGRALSRRPKVFLMDEPLSNLDAKLRVRMRFEIKRLHLEQGSTTIYVTHDQAEAMTMSDLIAVMDGGLLQQYSSPSQVYDRPANLFVAGFVGSPAMNFLVGEWHLDEQGTTLHTPAVTLSLPPVIGRALRAASAPAAVSLGIRPEDIEVGPAESATASGETVLIEQMGADDYLHVGLGPQDLMVRVPAGQAYRRGDQVGLWFKPHKIHIFDAATERRIDYEAYL